MKAGAVATLCIFLCLALTACGFPRGMELSRRLIIEAVGIDLTDAGVNLTLQTPDADGAKQGASGNSSYAKTKIYNFEGRNAAEALSGVREATGLTPLYSQVKLLLFSAGIERSVLRDILLYLTRETYLRADVTVCAAEGTAAEILTADTGAGTGAASLWQDALRSAAENGSTVLQPLFRFLSLLEASDGAACCPVTAAERKDRDGTARPALRGALLFGENGRLRLNETEAADLALLRGGFRQGAVTLNAPDGAPFTVSLSEGRTGIRLKKNGKIFTARIRVKAVCALRAPQTEEADETHLRETAQAALETRLSALLEKLSRGGFDFLRLSRRAAIRYPGFSKADAGALRRTAVVEVVLSESI